MMRASEMILIEAEAKAHLGMADAGDVLFALQSNRDPNAVKSGNTGQDLINEIALERRKELYGEIGINYLDIKRLQLPLTRSGNHDPGVMYDIPANDPAFILKIPQRELDANPNINDADQNP
ncbi:SusD family protein [compost metagenome]